MMRSAIIIGLLFFNLGISQAQNLSHHNWYFGNTADGIRFNRGTNKAQAVTNQALPFGTGGSAVATDPATANLLFYTDGNRIYDGCHLLMPNGSGLLGNSSNNQPIVISPIPAQPNKYFVFANSANFTTGGSITSSVVDMVLFGNAAFPAPAQGNVEVANKNAAVPGLSNRSEAMLVIPHSNGTDFWLITHQNSSTNYMATLINAASYTAGTFLTISSGGIGLPISVGNFSYNHKLKKIAISTQSTNDDALIADFNPATGVIVFDRYIFNTGLPTTASQSIYDIQWDIKGGQYLYLSRTGEAGINADVLQYDYTNSNPGIPTTVITTILTAPIFRSYGLQLAPDSAIYHLYQAVSGGPFLIDKFTKTDTIASRVIRTAQPFGAIDFKATQFPAFAPPANANLIVAFTTTPNNCQNNNVTFFPDVKPNADSVRWNFGDGQSSKAWSPIHKFTNNQSYSVTLTAFYQGIKTTVTQPVVINKFDLKIQLVQDTTACRSEFPPPRGSSSPTQFSVKVKVTQGTATSYNWSNGNTGPILKPDSAGYYYVVVTDATGCSTYAGVNVKEYKLQDQRSNIWYFGNKAGINFNKNPPVALNTSAMDAPAGCAIVCDRNGMAIFYTDGDKVYDRTNTQIDVGIGGDPNSSQSSLIVSVPGDETLYYIFTTQQIPGAQTYELRYSLFDLKKNSGNGAVTKKNILLFTKSTEHIAANGRWMVAHEYGNNTFRSYQITNQGIGEAVYTEIGSIHSFKTTQNGQGYMKLGARNNLAVPLSTPGTSNIIEVFQLNDTTGQIRNYRKVDMNEPKGQVYGIEFSAGARKLFATVKGAPTATESEIFEYYLDSLDVKPPVFLQKITKPMEMGALQLAPDGQIYMAYNDAASNKTLGTITANENKIPTSSSVNFNGFSLAGGTNSRLGLPNFIQQQGNGFGGPGFTFAGVCVGDTTKFNGTPTDAIDKFQWAFGDGASSTVSTPKHKYAAAGTYTVSMRLTNRCGLDTTIVQPVKINPAPARPTNPRASPLCNGPVTLDAGPAASYIWTNGATSRTVIITNPAVISVTTTDANGCKATAQSLVADNRPQVNLGPDLDVCQNNATANLDAKNPGAVYVWSLNGAGNGNSSQTQAVDTTLPASLKYSVTVTDPLTTCKVTDQIVVTVKVSPSFSFTGVNPTCNNADGSLTISFASTAPAGGPYSYFISGPTFNQQGIDQNAPSTIGPIAGQRAGTYSGIVTDQISGCTISSALALSDAVFTASATFTTCDPSLVTVTATAGTVGALQYTFIPVPVLPPSFIVVGPQVGNTASLKPGNYSIQVRDGGGLGCTYVFNQLVNPIIPTVTITPSLCTNPATLTASIAGVGTFNWTLPNGTTTAGPTINLGNTNASGTYKVDVTIPGGCIISQSTSIVYNGLITPTFTQSNACATTALLSSRVTPAGSYTYRWFRNGVLDQLGPQISITTADDGASYAVEVVDAINGCIVRSSATPVAVSGLVDASVTATQACDDGKPFTITSATTAIGVITYSWFFNNSATPIAQKTQPTLIDSIAGNYKVKISKASCSAEASILITKAPLPLGELIDRVIICSDPDNKDPKTSSVDLNPGLHTTYDWMFRKSTASSFTSLSYFTQIYNANTDGIFKVAFTNSFGCTNSDQTEVLNECIPKIVGPNAFRPTSQVENGINNHFFVYSFFVTDNFEVAIFNRWGELIFESKDKNFKWNGGYGNNAGQPLPGGTYSYVIRYQSSFRPQEGTREQRGGVVLLR